MMRQNCRVESGESFQGRSINGEELMLLLF